MLEDRKTIYYDNILGDGGQFEKEKSQIFMIIREIRFISAISKFSEYLQHWEDFKKYKRCYVERPQGERIWKNTLEQIIANKEENPLVKNIFVF